VKGRIGRAKKKQNGMLHMWDLGSDLEEVDLILDAVI
jgi:hypothetical protein